MNLIRKSTWMALTLAALIGCAGDDEASPKPSNPGSAPSGAMAKKSEPATTTPSKDMTPAPAKEDVKSSKPTEAPKLEGPNQTSNSATPASKLTGEELAAIKQLPTAEQAVAIKQAICPVSNHHLGSMDKPVKVSAQGRTFYICCEGCEEEVKSNPASVLAKLDQTGKK